MFLGACTPTTGHHVQVHSQAETADQAATSQATPRFVSPYTYEWFIRAELFVAQGDLARAADAYRRALAGADEDPLVIARLALTLDALGETDQAQTLLAQGDSLDAESEALWLARGQIAERHADREGAIAAYQRAQTYAPHSARPTLRLAHVLNDAPERALAVLREFRQRNERWTPQRQQVELAMALREGDLAAAVEALRALQTMACATMRDAEAVARLAWQQKRTWLARQLLGNAPERAIDRTLWLRVLIAVRELSVAGQVLAQATPEEFGGTAAMAGYYLALGDQERAADLASLSLARGPSDAATITLLRAKGMPALAAEVERVTAAAASPADGP